MNHVRALLLQNRVEQAMLYVKTYNNRVHPLEGDLVDLAVKRGLTRFLQFLIMEMYEVVQQKHMFTAVKANNIPMVALLVQMGFSVNVFHTGRSYLGLSAAEGNVMMSRKLMKVGADVNARDRNGCTPLLNCAENAPQHKIHLMLRLLFKSGADERDTNKSGKSVVDLLEARGYHYGKTRRVLHSVSVWRQKQEFSLVSSSFLGVVVLGLGKPKRRTGRVLKRRKTAAKTLVENNLDALAEVLSFL